MECNLENAFILITDYKINSINEILHILEECSRQSRPLFIICEDIENEVIATLVLNKIRGAITTAVVKAPAYGEKRKEYMQDIATITGGTFITNECGFRLNEADINSLGFTKVVKVTKDSTLISGGNGKREEIDNRVNFIKNQIEQTSENFEKEKLKERLSKLDGGIAVISVGSATEIEMQEKKLRIEDAVSATKSAIEEGIVAGGGVAYIKSISSLTPIIESLIGDEKTGAEIVKNALYSPLRQIAENAGIEGAVVVQNILNNGNKNFGYDASKNEYVDMINSGIIDPTKVTKTALINAVSIASTLLTTECVICDLEEEKQLSTLPTMY